MLNSLSSLKLCVDLCRGGRYIERVSRNARCEGSGAQVNIPAAAAASITGFFDSEEPSLPNGLRSLPESERRAGGGDRERRSNREALLGSGSV